MNKLGIKAMALGSVGGSPSMNMTINTGKVLDEEVSNIEELEKLIEQKDGDYIHIKYKDFVRLLNVLKAMASHLDFLSEEQTKLTQAFDVHDHKDGRLITYKNDVYKNKPPYAKYNFSDDINELVKSMF